MNDLARMRRHSAWIAWTQKLKRHEEKPGPDPGPGYKDCINCPLRPECDTPEERTALCLDSCPYDVDEVGQKMPSGPSVRFITAQLWSRLPDSILSDYAGELGVRFLMDVETLRDERGSRLFG